MNTDLLVKRLQQKRDVLRQLLQLGRCQSRMTQPGATGSVMKLLAAKQRLVTALQAVDAALEPFRGQDPEARIWRRPADRAAARELAAECDRLLADAMALELDGDDDARRDRPMPGAPPASFRTVAPYARWSPRSAEHVGDDGAAAVAVSLDLTSDA